MITPAPDLPNPAEPTTFRTRAINLFYWIVNTFVGELETEIANVAAIGAAMNLNDTTDTSASSVLIGTGSKSFTASVSKSYLPGMYLVMASTAAPTVNSMIGQIASYDSGTGALVVNVLRTKGSGTIAAWTLTFSAAPSEDISAAMLAITSAATVAAGRTALGSTTVGDALFVAASTGAAQDALGGTASGKAIFSGTQTAARIQVDAPAPAFSVVRTSTQSITSGVITKIQCQTEDYDKDASYDAASTYLFTAKVAGVHHFEAALGFFGSTAPTRAFATFYKNGAEHKRGQDVVSGYTVTASADMDLAVNDTVGFYGFITATTPVADANTTYFQGSLVRAA